MASMATYSVESTEHSEAGTIFASTFKYYLEQHGRMLHVTAEIAPRKSHNLVARICVTTASGSFQGWLGTALQWDRPEGLAHVSSNVLGKEMNAIALLSLSASTATPSNVESPMKFLPAQKFRSLTTILEPLFSQVRSVDLWPHNTAISKSDGRDWLSDAFGYRKLVIAGTKFGKIYALDLGNGGKVIWEQYLVPVDLRMNGWKTVSWRKIAVFDDRTDKRVLLVAVAVVENMSVGFN